MLKSSWISSNGISSNGKISAHDCSDLSGQDVRISGVFCHNYRVIPIYKKHSQKRAARQQSLDCQEKCKEAPKNQLLLDPFQHLDFSGLGAGGLAWVAEYERRNKLMIFRYPHFGQRLSIMVKESCKAYKAASQTGLVSC
jgi:hypothetical protein